MSLQESFSLVALSAHVALMIPHAAIVSHVSGERPLAHKEGSARRAVVRRLSGVREFVSRCLQAARKACAAIIARVRFLAVVRIQPVMSEAGLPSVGLVALVAGVPADGAVGGGVAVELPAVFEALVAVGAGVQAGGRVGRVAPLLSRVVGAASGAFRFGVFFALVSVCNRLIFKI